MKEENTFSRKFCAFHLAIILSVLLHATDLVAQDATPPVIDIGNRLELLVDDYLIERLDGAQLQLQKPQLMADAAGPFAGASYATIIKEDDLYRAYYRATIPGYTGTKDDGNAGEITRYAESDDGIHWRQPALGICEINGSRDNNVILQEAPFCHNFSPFLDSRPGQKDRGARFKAIAGTVASGLYAFSSADGIHWKKMQDTPGITANSLAFDSQNVAFWSEAENCYVCYFRTWHDGLRGISRATSADLRQWGEAVATHANLGEHLYTSQTHPYFRAPHLYIALPSRFQDKRGNSTDILFMTARAGSTTFSRIFQEAFIRPGLDPTRWGNRANYAALNVIPTGPAEMSIYHSGSGLRYTLRTDGFASAHAGQTPGQVLTKPLTFTGKELILNYSTAAAGSIQVELQQADGTPIPGFHLADCPMIIGDHIERRVNWQSQPDLAALQGKPVHIHFVITDGDLYSFRFR